MRVTAGQLAAFAAKVQFVDATAVAQRSPWHGPPHWKDVARFGIEYAAHAAATRWWRSSSARCTTRSA